MPKAMNDEIIITFKKRSMSQYLIVNRIHTVLKIDSMDDDIEQVFAINFGEYLSRTDTIELCTDKPCQNAIDWVNFWQSVKHETDYAIAFQRYKDELNLDHNNEWRDAMNAHDNNEVGRIDPELGSPELLPPSVLNDPEVKKNGKTTVLETEI